ncbi:MAG TPA: nuclear transport factor 2 family protein [Actinophytocola sp.]|uniref:nuclear transport factor 2 family protein n=1 Tax=Actinophytocola sp. TaxID=1872138 RepID=UPI002DDD5712|nr:nuclear transport factor 2 family protein [Actinophytocola sp.]HEV2777840.1 nuclear transport factor 2 family protein [Actinophytocola sp.]
MNDDHLTASWPSACDPTSVAMDHVRLSYCYLDDGDVDAYRSLFAEPAAGRAPQADRSCRHLIYEVFGSGRRVAAIGRRLSQQPVAGERATDVHFVDVFTVADNGLLVDRMTFLSPPCC